MRMHMPEEVVKSLLRPPSPEQVVDGGAPHHAQEGRLVLIGVLPLVRRRSLGDAAPAQEVVDAGAPAKHLRTAYNERSF